MISRVFHNWERKLAAAAENRVVRPFEWGLEWIEGVDEVHRMSPNVLRGGPHRRWPTAMPFFALPSCDDYTLTDDRLRFPSAVTTPHPENNVVHARYFPDRSERGSRRAVVVLPQWNADAEGHVGFCRLLNRFGISALRLSLPYHDARMPPELRRADYIVSSNVGRTAQVCRQAVLDTRRAIAWLSREGYESIGILGTSLGSCLSMLTAAHEPLFAGGRAQSHLAVLRRRDLGRAVDRTRARESRRTDSARHPAPDLDADLSVSLPRTPPGKGRPARCTPDTI